MSAAAVVTKSSPVLVVPSESETAAAPLAGDTTVALSSFDMCMLPFPMRLLLVFDRPIHEPAETIKTALSRGLAHYRPVAGRLDGKGGIACTDEGVAFVAASVGCALDEAAGTVPKMDLTVRCPGLFCRDVDPMLVVQVTEFSCGGFAVGVTWNHVLTDGAGLGQFLQAVGELARGVSPPTVVPVRHWHESLMGLPTSMVEAQKSMIEGNGGPYYDLARHDFHVPLSLIRRIKAEHGCTVFEAAAAVIWQCRTRAAMSPADPESPAPLSFACNVRALAGATPGYYGNCVVGQLVPATSGAVASSSIGDLVRLIRRAKEKVPDKLSSSSDGEAADGQQVEWYNGFAVVSWLGLGFDAADFGGGGAARVMWHEDRSLFPSCMLCPPCRGDAVDVSSLSVKPEHAGAFLGELAKLAAAT